MQHIDPGGLHQPPDDGGSQGGGVAVGRGVALGGGAAVGRGGAFRVAFLGRGAAADPHLGRLGPEAQKPGLAPT